MRPKILSVVFGALAAIFARTEESLNLFQRFRIVGPIRPAIADIEGRPEVRVRQPQAAVAGLCAAYRRGCR